MITKKIKNTLLDKYFEFSILGDLIIIALMIIAEKTIITPIFVINKLTLITPLERTDALNYTSNLISTSISLAGFIIAALTIMITVKSSLTARGFEDSNNALEYLFSTKHYRSIIGVFKISIVELLISSLILYLTWLYVSNINSATMQRIIFCTTYGVVMAIVRAVFILFKILGLEKLVKR